MTTRETCEACGNPIDGLDDDLCQSCCEDWCDEEFFASEAGLLAYSEERYQTWLEKRKETRNDVS